MRKLSLLAAAAMVAGGSAFAMDGGGVSISGEANFGVKFKEDRNPGSEADLQFHHEFDIKFTASGTTDGGISFGAKMTLDNQESTDIAVSGGVVTPGSDGTAAVAASNGESFWRVSGFDETDNNKVSSVDWSAKDGRPDGDADREIDPTAYATAIQTLTANSNGVRFTVDGAGIDLDAVSIVTGQTDGLITRGTFDLTDWNRNNDGEYFDGTTAINPTPEAIEAYNAYVAAYNLGDDGRIGGTGGDADTPKAGDLVVVAAVAQSDGTPATAPAITPVNASGGKVGNHAEVYISMDMHTLTIGSDIDAADKIAGGLTDPGFDGIGIDDQAEAVWGGTAADVRYDGDFGVAKVAISYGDNNDDAEWAAGFSFDVEPVTMGAGFDSHGVVSLGMGFSQGQIAMNALYSTDSDAHEADNEKDMAGGTYKWTKGTGDDATTHMVSLEKVTANAPDVKNQAMGVDVTYKMNDTTSLVLVAAQHTMEGAKWAPKETDNDKLTDGASGVEGAWRVSDTKVDAFGVGFAHDLGGGATLKAGAGSVDSDAVADLGITMTF